jgi:acyl-CoA synthetase (AMP-forming)/AMP-acid ligase II
MVAARAQSEDTWLILPRDPISSHEAMRLTFREICDKASEFSNGLLRTGLVEKDRPVILVFDNNEQFCVALLGCILAGAIPCVRSPPWLYPRFAAELKQIIDQSRAGLVVVDDTYDASIPDDCRQAASCLTATEVMANAGASAALPAHQPYGAPALIQYSSGSTRAPRGVALSNAAVLSNIRGIGAVLEPASTDVAVSWLPVSHDMGLIASLLFSFYWGLPLVFLSPLTFVAKPARWLWALSKFGGTMSAAPNFAFSLCASKRRVLDEALRGLDLRSWRAAICGAETVQSETVAAFSDRFAGYGFREESLCPAYGLAENSVACTIDSPRRKPRQDIVDREMLETASMATRVSRTDHRRTSVLMSTGRPIPGTQIRIVGDSGGALAEREIGEIEVKGESTMRGYWMSLDATRASVTADGWIRTGDLGYLCDGELYVCGRRKQIIKRAGRCYDAAEMAEIVGRTPGIRRGCVSVFGVPDPVSGSERVVVLAEVKDNWSAFEPTVSAIIESTCGMFGLRPDQVLLLKSGSLPKTSSGKIQVGQCGMLFSAGVLSRGSLFAFPPSEAFDGPPSKR